MINAFKALLGISTLSLTMLASRPRLLLPFSRRTSQLSRLMTTSTIRLVQRPADWKAAAPDLPSTVTFAPQSKLPKLPVPKLPDTLERLKENLKPIAWSNAEFDAVSRKIDEFGTGKGAELHERLLKHNEKTRHWLEQWWDDTAYLGYRDSVSCARGSFTLLTPRNLTCVTLSLGYRQCIILLYATPGDSAPCF